MVLGGVAHDDGAAGQGLAVAHALLPEALEVRRGDAPGQLAVDHEGRLPAHRRHLEAAEEDLARVGGGFVRREVGLLVVRVEAEVGRDVV